MNQLLEKYFQIVKNIIPEKVQVTTVGIDIGVGSCKIIELVKSGETYEILRFGIEPINNADLGGTLKGALSHLNIQSKSVTTAVFGKGTLIRYIEMPRMALEDLKKSFAIEADKYFPFPIDQIYTDCYILDPKGKDKKMSVLVAAAKKEIINERVQLLTSIGLQTNFIGINPLAIANVFNVLGDKNSPQGAGSTIDETKSLGIAVLDLGEKVSNLTILKDNIPRFTRDIFIGGQELTKRISNNLGVSMEEANRLKRQPGGKLEEVLNACESVLMNLISEVRLSFDYFITEKNVQISKLYLTGGSSMLEGIVEFFSKNLDIQIERWNPIANLKIGPDIAAEDLNKNVGSLGVALGLSLYQND